ncbi:hypothetical protein SIPHO049v1_p0052 [Vibrio phage PS14A.1]|nr:hypothetical protein SIPHO049v1_p0052 [Vibrio phage PS14A.1]
MSNRIITGDNPNQLELEKGRVHIAGVISELLAINSPTTNAINLPPADNGTVTYNSSTGVVRNHSLEHGTLNDAVTAAFAEADGSADIEVRINRVDMYGLEQFDMVIKDDEVFDMVQSKSATFGDTDVPTVDSVRPDSFFAVYDGQTGITKGKCVKWSTLTDVQKRKVDEYMKERLWVNEDGELTFTTIRQRSIAGASNGNWINIDSNASGGDLNQFKAVLTSFVIPQGDYDSVVSLGDVNSTNGIYCGVNSGSGYKNANLKGKGIFQAGISGGRNSLAAYKGRCFFYVLGTVSRLNQGAYYPSLNESGCRTMNYVGIWNNGKWHGAGAYKPTTKAECFIVTNGDPANNDDRGAYLNSGAIGQTSGRTDGRYYDAIYADDLGGVVDYRLSAYAMSSPEEGSKVLAKDDYRGLELVGKVSVSGSFTHTYTETTGGLITLPRECLSSTVECVHSSDGGATWNKTNPNVNLTNNTVTLPSGGESIVSFTAFAKQTKPSTNKKVLNATSGLLGIVTTQNHSKSTFAEAVAGIILKSDASGITTEQSNAVKFMVDETISRIKTLANDMAAPTNSSQAVKVAVYQISDNGQCKLGFIANTMSHNGTDWGELEEMHIPSGSSDTFPDANNVTQLAMITESALPYGWTHNHARAGTQVEGVDL